MSENRGSGSSSIREFGRLLWPLLRMRTLLELRRDGKSALVVKMDSISTYTCKTCRYVTGILSLIGPPHASQNQECLSRRQGDRKESWTLGKSLEFCDSRGCQERLGNGGVRRALVDTHTPKSVSSWDFSN